MPNKIQLLYLKFVKAIAPYKEKLVSFDVSNFSVYIAQGRDFLSHNYIIILKFALPCLLVLFILYSCSASRRILSQNITSIFAIADEIRTYYQSKPDYWKLSTQVLTENSVIPSDFLADGDVVLNGDYKLLFGEGADAQPASPGARTFDIILPNLNKAQCISYVEAKLSDENLLALEKITIHNSSGEYVYTWGGKYTLPVPKYSSKDLCQSDENIVFWTLK